MSPSSAGSEKTTAERNYATWSPEKRSPSPISSRTEIFRRSSRPESSHGISRLSALIARGLPVLPTSKSQGWLRRFQKVFRETPHSSSKTNAKVFLLAPFLRKYDAILAPPAQTFP